ncbi:MAG TPA: tRNA pseudouridine(38-40) synthase TruA [Pirellulaceae bacterium]|nr:tRNA pseudouridine(38-40) synthase TruA [Pirellulaceae bacterium]
MPAYMLTIAYDGTDFAGWQRQPHKRTVQGEMELAWSVVTGEKVHAVASGRTDAGVHALGQVVSVQSRACIPGERMRAALNRHLPEDIVVRDAAIVRDGFHAIREARRKRYRYLVQDGRLLDPLSKRSAWHVKYDLDADAMNRAGQLLVGTHDFASFETSGSQRLTTERTVFEVLVERPTDVDGGVSAYAFYAPICDPRRRLVIEVEADGFLYNMVRNIAGTLVAVGRGKHPESWVADVLAAKDRRKAGMAAPPQGLYLLRVEYDPADLAVESDVDYGGDSNDDTEWPVE